jgi:hypothetical protein
MITIIINNNNDNNKKTNNKQIIMDNHGSAKHSFSCATAVARHPQKNCTPKPCSYGAARPDRVTDRRCKRELWPVTV